MIFEHWGSTDEETKEALPGDDLIGDPAFSATRSITISAPPTEVFPWVAQLGFGRAGWYSYDLIDNFGRKSATTLNPEWAVHSVGDVVPGGPINFSVREIDAPNHLVLELSSARRSPRLTFTMSYVLRPIGDSTRLISRVRSGLRAPFGTVLLRSTLGPGDGVMLRRQLLGIKERAEQHNR
ncbi:MAG: hypothetical protein ACPGO8_09105 [Ilumatobacteraceae bacterium]